MTFFTFSIRAIFSFCLNKRRARPSPTGVWIQASSSPTLLILTVGRDFPACPICFKAAAIQEIPILSMALFLVRSSEKGELQFVTKKAAPTLPTRLSESFRSVSVVFLDNASARAIAPSSAILLLERSSSSKVLLDSNAVASTAALSSRILHFCRYNCCKGEVPERIFGRISSVVSKLNSTFLKFSSSKVVLLPSSFERDMEDSLLRVRWQRRKIDSLQISFLANISAHCFMLSSSIKLFAALLDMHKYLPSTLALVKTSGMSFQPSRSFTTNIPSSIDHFSPKPSPHSLGMPSDMAAQ